MWFKNVFNFIVILKNNDGLTKKSMFNLPKCVFFFTPNTRSAYIPGDWTTATTNNPWLRQHMAL